MRRTIRPGREADRAGLAAILTETFENTWRPAITRHAAHRYETEDRARWFADRHWARCLVAEMPEGLAGLGFADDGFIDALHVRPAFAGQGVGQDLLAGLEHQMRRDGHRVAPLETDTFNLRARAFYRRAGYVELDTYPDEEWDSGLTTVLMVKSLRKG